MRLLVTGGAGFIGSNFIGYWLGANEDDEIVNVDLLTYAGDLRSLAEVERAHGGRYRFVRGDIADFDAINATVAGARPDVIINFAAESHNSRALINPAIFVRTNVLGTQVVLEAARRNGVGRVHHISTCEVYGDIPLESAEVFTEASPYRPRTPYNASKAAADLMVRAYHKTFGTPVTISVSCNNYGPMQHPEKMIPLFATNAFDMQPLPLYRHSENRREWIHVEDHCRAIAAILRGGSIGETYNVGSGDERSVMDVADAILEITRRPESLKTFVEDRPGHDRRYLLDHRKIGRELGWRPLVSFDEGLRRTVTWYEENEEWWRPKKETELDEFSWSPMSVSAGR